MVDKVKPLKIETAADGTQIDPFPIETDPSMDYLAAKGVSLEILDTTRIFGDSGIMKFQDADVTNVVTLSDLLNSNITLTNIIYVAKNGNDNTTDGSLSRPFLTVKAACDYVAGLTPSSTNLFKIIVAPGVYQEDSFTLPTYTSLEGVEDFACQIEANNNAANLITCSTSSTISNLQLSGVTNSSNYLIYFNNQSSSIVLKSLFLRNSSNGIYLNNDTTTTFGTLRNIRLGSLTGIGLDVRNNMNITVFNVLGGGLNTAFNLVENCIVTISNGRVTSYNTGLYLDDTAEVYVTTLNLSEELTGMPVHKNSVDSFIKLVGAIYDQSRCSIIGISKYRAVINNSELGEPSLAVSEELHVGLPELGRESAFGEGDSFVRQMLVFTETSGGSFTDVTADAKYDDASSFTFTGTGVGNKIYVGCTALTNSGDFYKFFGCKVDVDTAASGGEITAEYWNGSTWAEFNHMSIADQPPKLKYAKQIFQRAQSEHINFDDGIDQDWIKNDPMSLGTNYYWIRFNIVSAVSTAPVFERVKLLASAIQINEDGYLQYFGKSRPVKPLPFTYNNFEAANQSPTNQDLYLDDTIATGRIENKMDAGGLLDSADKIGFAEFMPLDIDTSCKVKIFITFATDSANPTGTDTVGFRIYWNKSSDLDEVWRTTAQAPTTSVGRQEMNVSTTVTLDDTQYTAVGELDFSDFIPRDADNKSDILWLTIRRNPSIDNYNDDINVINVRFLYVCCDEGGHL